jgi:hypothetical protein
MRGRRSLPRIVFVTLANAVYRSLSITDRTRIQVFVFTRHGGFANDQLPITINLYFLVPSP